LILPECLNNIKSIIVNYFNQINYNKMKMKINKNSNKYNNH